MCLYAPEAELSHERLFQLGSQRVVALRQAQHLLLQVRLVGPAFVEGLVQLLDPLFQRQYSAFVALLLAVD